MVPQGAAVEPPRLEHDRFVAADGAQLPLAEWPTADGKEPKAVILGLHGFGDYRDAFEKPAKIWAKDGIATFAYDQRGFGESPTRGRWAGTDTLVDDAKAMARSLRARYPKVPLYVVGESMGGAVALVAADRGLDADGLILSAPGLRSRQQLGKFASAGLSFFVHLAPWMPFGPTSIDFHPTDDPETLDKLSKDPRMLRYPRFDMGWGLADLMDDACAAATRLSKPYLLMHGLGDRIVPDEPVKAAIETMPPRPDSKLAFYKKGYHLLMRDRDGPKVAADVAAWIANHEAPLPSGDEAEHTQPKIAALWGAKRTQHAVPAATLRTIQEAPSISRSE